VTNGVETENISGHVPARNAEEKVEQALFDFRRLEGANWPIQILPPCAKASEFGPFVDRNQSKIELIVVNATMPVSR
jgi:hypothetical protein